MDTLQRTAPMCTCRRALRPSADGTAKIVTCACGARYLVAVRFGQALATEFNGDMESAVHQLTLRYGALLARHRFADDPDRAAVYFTAVKEMAAGEAASGLSPRTVWLLDTGAILLWRCRRVPWMGPVLRAYSRLLWRAYGGMSPGLREAATRAFGGTA